ncbi:MAG: glycoside hydrolase family 95 protein, partial [Alistipes sp.]|nr:glycoside hydrolase family 95 protein [Alistipes sp.]
RCRGGFVLDEMTWRGGRLAGTVLRSTIGGTLRLRSAVPLLLDGKPLPPAAGECPNPLLQPQAIRTPRVSEQAPAAAASTQKYYLYDVETAPGKVYRFTCAGPEK